MSKEPKPEVESSELSEDPNLNAEPGDDEGNPNEEGHADDNAARRNKVPAGKRIRQLTRKYRESERKNEELLQRLDALEKRIGPEPEAARPNYEDFDTREEYEDALLEWADAKKTAKSEPKPEAKAPAADIIEEFEDELENEIGEHAVALVMEGDFETTQDMTDYIMSSDVRAHLAYHIASNPELSSKIAKMPTIRAARELEKVEEELSSNLKRDREPENTPPPPLESTRPRSASIVNGDKMSTEQWVAERRRQLEERG